MLAPIIDYISFSIPIPDLMRQWDYCYNFDIPFDVDERTWKISEYLARQTNWLEYNKRGIFKRMINFDDIGIAYHDGHKDVTLIQISGKGMELFRNDNRDLELLSDWKDRVTRIDIATDIITDLEAEDFAKCRGTSRLKDGGHHPSDTGITWYIGSRSSDRFARVYRYNPPLPRSDRVRIEFQLNDDQAKHAAPGILSKGLVAYRDELFRVAAFNHPLLEYNPNGIKAPSAPRLSSKGGTALWLYQAVLPALRRLKENGDDEVLIDFDREFRRILNSSERPSMEELYARPEATWISDATLPMPEDSSDYHEVSRFNGRVAYQR